MHGATGRPRRIALVLIGWLFLLAPLRPATGWAQTPTEAEELARRIEELERTKKEHEDATEALTREQEELERRLADLEAAKTAQEDATRAIIQDALSTADSNINAFVVFGGTFEQVAGWVRPFEGPVERVIQLVTAELDFEINVNEWSGASIVLEYNDGTDVVFPTVDDDVAVVDRIDIDTAYLTLGDTQRFPPYFVFGRVVAPFGISTGDPVADVLTLEDPLTIEIFEMKEDIAGFGLQFPTPKRVQPTPRKSPPPVRPKVINPLVRKLGRLFGYRPPRTPPPAPGFVLPTTPPPPLHVGVYTFRGNTFDERRGDGWRSNQGLGATVGFRSKLVELDFDYTTTVFDSRFLEYEYRAFLDQIRYVPGLAGNVKMNLGPVPLIAEWNGALEDATFLDDAGRAVSIRPTAWQVSTGFQFGWNRWMEVLGAKGTYIALSYSESDDLGGVTREIGGEGHRVGFVPQKRFLASAGEWVLDGLRLAVEYSYQQDYPRNQGGTGATAEGVVSMVTFEW